MPATFCSRGFIGVRASMRSVMAALECAQGDISSDRLIGNAYTSSQLRLADAVQPPLRNEGHLQLHLLAHRIPRASKKHLIFQVEINSSRLNMTETQQPDAYLAKPPAQCCLTGSLHVGEPRGSIETIEGVDTYISKPKNGSGYGNIIFYFPDVWGLHKNGCLMMDGFADAGYTVFGIDYFRGDPVWKHRKDKSDTTTDPSFDFEAWKSKHTSFAFEVVPKWVPAVKEKYGSASTKFACVGYVRAD